MRQLRLSLSLALGFVALLVGAPAQAQCTGAGVPIGSCTGGLGYEGCCSGETDVNWCESGVLCEIQCSDNGSILQNAPCEVSAAAGSCDPDVTDCVCGIDPFCCDPDWGWDSFCVDEVIQFCGGCTTCPPPSTTCGWLGSEGYYDCRPAASADPTGQFPRTCGGGCSPSCAGRQCGTDGCGGSCGTCTGGRTCNASGNCVSSCTPNCAGKSCGSDGCSGTCGTCPSGLACTAAGTCGSSCTPNCAGKSCGSDGCGGSCGTCPSGLACTAAGTCGSSCTASCAGRACGDDGCGGSCGSCQVGATCQGGQCQVGCAPNCDGKACGDDGCGGTCGSCGSNEVCESGACAARPCSCVGRRCGDDGCGKVCGYCGPNTTCNVETYQCVANNPDPPDTSGGTDTGTIPECPSGQIWNQYAGTCVLGGDLPSGGAKSSSGCAGGADRGLSWLLAGLVLLGLSLTARRRERSARGV